MFYCFNKKLKKLNLTCGKPNHGNRHFLLCPIEGCRKGAEKLWQKQAEKKVVINLLPVDDVDLENEIIDVDYDDLDEKLEISDGIEFNQLFIPTLAIKNDENQIINYNFAKTFFRLEKVNALVPNSNETTPVIILFDCGSGKTVGNNIESLDGFENPHSTDIVLSSLNGIDRTQKRVCEVTIVGAEGEQFPIEVIIPADSIPKPPPQSMNGFKRNMGQKGKTHWIENITEEDINTLPIILLGLNYQKYFPREIPKITFGKDFQRANSGMAFFTSMFSNKTLASGIKEVDDNFDLINIVSYKLTEYNELNEEPKEFSQSPVRVEVIHPDNSDPIEENIIHEVTSTNLNEIEKIIGNDLPSEIITIVDDNDLQDLNYDREDSQDLGHENEIDLLNQAVNQDLQATLETDEATISLINMIRFEDRVHEGKDEATINLVSKLEAETKAEETQYNKQKDEKVRIKVAKTTQNFPPLKKPQKQ